MPSEHLKVDVADDGCLDLTLARTARKNAFTGDMYEGFADALERFATDDALTCLVIRAEGDVFCAGNDLNDFLEQDPIDMGSPVVRVLLALASAEKPLVALVDGPAVGIGTTLLLHCDFVIATEAARFSTPFGQLGLVPEAASSLLFPAMLGHRRAMEMFLLGTALDAQQALDCGLVNSVVKPAALEAQASELTRRLALLIPNAVRATKRLCRAPLTALTDTIEREIAEFAPRLESEQTRQAIGDVLNRRRK